MFRIYSLIFLLVCRALAAPHAMILPSDDTRRIEVLFLGAPTANHPAHDPVERYRVLKKNLGSAGINLSYTDDLDDLRRDILDRYDAIMIYGNWRQNGAMEPAWEKALLDYVSDGGAFLPVHCASACFGGSDAFVKLVGARFKSHGTAVFNTTITAPDHPLIQGYAGFETWDETYVHDRLSDDRTVLQKRGDEPWTWVRQQGKGRVFYTAYGHDMRCWSQPQFHELLRRAILWCVRPAARAMLEALQVPVLENEEMQLPGYRERKAITRGQKPLNPEQSIKLTQVPAGFEVSLFASEPDIVNPISIAWDERGRAFVVETVDYPNNLQAGNLGHDRIHLCEDTDGDGRADKFTLFADKLSIPTSIVCVNGGVICTNGTQVIFLKDTDGDGMADERKVLLDGFGMHDTHAGVSNLRYGFDNWIYATVGYSGFKGTVGGESFDFRQALFRFKPDGSKMEVLQNTTNNTWGLGFTTDFDIMGSTANANPSWFHTFPASVYQKSGIKPPLTPRADDNPFFFPMSTDIRQVDQHDRYTAAAGHAFYTAARFPEYYRDRIAFVCEPTGKLVGQFNVTRKGTDFVSRQLPNNLFGSADAWTAPVFAETGPDGAVWICDWYNLIVQHNPTPTVKSAGIDAVTGKGNAYETPLRDTRYGRIYRVYPKGTPNDPFPELDVSKRQTLLNALYHSNLFWRLQAQRLLVENHLGNNLLNLHLTTICDSGAASLHAFLALQGMDGVDAKLVRTALESSHRGLRRAAIAHPLSYGLLENTFTRNNVLAAADDRELAEVFVALSRQPSSECTGWLLHATLMADKDRIATDAVLADAWQIAASRHAKGVLRAFAASAPPPAAQTNLLPEAGFETNPSSAWSLRGYRVDDRASLEMKVVPGGRNGGNCLMIRSPARADAGAGVEVTVKPHTRYHLGGWIRTENLELRGGIGALMNIHRINAKTRPLTGTNDWTEVGTEFDSGDETRVLVHCLFGGYGGAVGTAWWDDMELREIQPGDVSPMIMSLADHFVSTANPADRQAAVAAIAGRTDAFSKKLLDRLRAVPVAATPAARSNKPDSAVHARGQSVFNRTCIACHGPEGKGVPGAFPPMDGSSWLTGDPKIPIRIVLHGLQGPIEVSGEKYNNTMAPLGNLTDQEIADVLTYVRQSWSNDAPAVSADKVRDVRAKHASRNLPWTAADLK